MGLRFCVGVVVAVVLNACGSVPSREPDAAVNDDADVVGTFTFAVSATALTIPIAGTGTLDVTVSRDQFAGDIMLSARDLPANVTVTFEPPTLSGGATTSIATFKSAAGTAAATTQVTLVASGSGIEHTVPVSFTATTITVAGTVARGRTGIKVVLVGGGSTTSSTGGAFSFSGVSPPYDLYTVSTETLTNTNVIHYYQGLTRPDPVVAVAQGNTATFVSSATINGTLTGRNVVHESRVMWSDSGLAVNGTANYSFGASWPGAGSRAGTLHALQWASGPSSIMYGSTPATLNSSGTHTVNVTLAMPTIGMVTGTFTKPAGFEGPHHSVTQQVGNQTVLWQQSFFTQFVNCLIPIIPAGKTTVWAHAYLGASLADDYQTTSYVRPEIGATADVSFTLPLPAVLGTPGDDVIGVNTSSDFTFTAPTSTVHALRASTTGTTKVAYNIYSTATTIRIPNLPTDAPLPSAQAFTWSVTGYGPHTSVDGVATASGLDPIVENDNDTTGPAHTYTTSAKRQFTSQ